MARAMRRSSIAAKVKEFPLWVKITGAVLGAVLAALASVVAARGPHLVRQELEEAFGKIAPPKIVAVSPKKEGSKAFVVSIANPSLRTILITGYEVESMVAFASDGPMPIVKSRSMKPVRCGDHLKVGLEQPIEIGPGRHGGLDIEPFDGPCDFTIKVEGTTGVAEGQYWTPASRALKEELEVAVGGLEVPPEDIKSCPGGARVVVTDDCPPPPPPPPAPPREP